MKIKRQSRTIHKKHEGELYTFKNGVAKIPGMWHKNPRKPYLITLKEFNEIRGSKR